MTNHITAQLQNISKHPSKYGGEFYYLFFKDIETGKGYKSCVSPNYRNWTKWDKIIENFQLGKTVILSNLIIKNGLVDADSNPKVEEPNE